MSAEAPDAVVCGTRQIARADAMGRTAAHHLLAALKGEQRAGVVHQISRVVVRGSTVSSLWRPLALWRRRSQDEGVAIRTTARSTASAGGSSPLLISTSASARAR